MSEVTSFSQSLKYCQDKLDLAMEHFSDIVKNAVCEDKDEEKMELLTFIQDSTKTLQKFTNMLFEEPKVIEQKRSIETSEQEPAKKLNLSPSPLMDLPNEIWMKILNHLPTYDILKNFNLTCKQFHSLAISPGAIKSLQLKLENFKESTQYQEVVKVLKRSKTLNKLVINGFKCGHMNHILAHALKLNHLKTLEVSILEATMTKNNLEYLKNSSIEELKLDNIILDDDAMQKIGALKTLKSVRISNFLAVLPRMKISELIKTFIDVKTGLEDIAIISYSNDIEINASNLYEFLKEKAETLKKLKVSCVVTNDDRKEDMIWNVTSNLEELYYHNSGDHNLSAIKIELGLDMPRLTKLAIRNIDGDINMFGTHKFPALERLYLSKAYENRNGPNVSRKTIFNILKNCPNLKSLKIMCNELSDPQPADVWFVFLCQMYKNFNVYLDLTSYYYSCWNTLWRNFENDLKETDLATYYKYTKMKANYVAWKKEQFPIEW